MERRFGKEELGMETEDAHVRLPALVESTRRTIFNEFPFGSKVKGTWERLVRFDTMELDTVPHRGML